MLLPILSLLGFAVSSLAAPLASSDETTNIAHDNFDFLPDLNITSSSSDLHSTLLRRFTARGLPGECKKSQKLNLPIDTTYEAMYIRFCSHFDPSSTDKNPTKEFWDPAKGYPDMSYTYEITPYDKKKEHLYWSFFIAPKANKDSYGNHHYDAVRYQMKYSECIDEFKRFLQAGKPGKDWCRVPGTEDVVMLPGLRKKDVKGGHIRFQHRAQKKQDGFKNCEKEKC